MIDTGTATSGINVVRNLPRNRKTTNATSRIAIDKRVNDLIDRRRNKDSGVEEHGVGEVVREARCEIAHRVADVLATSTALDPGDW